MNPFPKSIEVIDSHTGGEPTRVVVSGWPTPQGETMSERRAALLGDGALRRAVVLEPRGHDALVGALLTPPVENGSAAGVVFFNNVSVLRMCGHGMIGVVRTLEFLGRVAPGALQVDTPVGTVGAVLGDDGSVTIENVPARCHALDVEVDVPGVGRVKGDVAYGGNWFFLTNLDRERLALADVDRLTSITSAIRRALAHAGISGAGGAEIDHVEIFGPPERPDADSRNFVLCPGGEYDRSACGTGTSAKLAVLHARGELGLNQVWTQESITGTLFTGWLEERAGALIPRIRGHAYITGRAHLFFDPNDPFRAGFSAKTASDRGDDAGQSGR